MTTCYISLLLLFITLEQSCCNEEEMLLADPRWNEMKGGIYDSSEKGSRTHQNDCMPKSLSYEKLRVMLEKDKDCYERKEKIIPFKYREDLKHAESTLKIEQPVEYVIVRASKENCTNEKQCKKLMQSTRLQALGKGCEPMDNFYVGGDGFVYEGRGWDTAPYWDLNGLRRKAITVQFFGDYMKTNPTPRVIEAFRTTLQIGVWLGKVSKNYKVTTMREILNSIAYLGDDLDKELMTWKNWANATFISSLWEYTISKRLTFVFRSQWNASEPLKELIPIAKPVGNVMISDGGKRCLNRTECISRVKSEQTELKTYYGDLLHNFYIGDEGEVYEGRGWDVASQWELPGIKNGLLSVRFIGSFDLEPPSENAINSLKLLIHTGVWLGKISPGYQLFSLRQVYRQRNLTGETLYKRAEGWISRWRHGESVSQDGGGQEQPSPIVSGSDWGANFPIWSFTSITVAVDYVIVYDGDGRCYSRRECTELMKTEEEKYRSHYGGLLDNFYVGEDGSIYEGRGWRRLPQWHSLFPGISLITVKFMGSFEKDEPMWLALTAFRTLIKIGVDSGMISPNHRLVALRQTTTVAPSLSNGLERRLMETKSWSNKIMVDTNGTKPLYRNLIFPRGKWATWPQPDYSKLKQPVVYVVIGSMGPRCFTQTSCLQVIKSRFDRKINGFNAVLNNFYIGEDGWAYEGKGWDGASQLNFKERDDDFLFVMFLGNFESTLPSPIAMHGFHHLMESGVRTGKLAPEYKILSIRQLFDDTKNPANMLSEDIKSWDRWTANILNSSGTDRSPSWDSIYVSRRDWNSVSWTPILKVDDRTRRVLVRNVGSRCFTREECTSVVRAEQNKSLARNHSDGFIMENFYVGEDGHVYEGRGWGAPPPWAWVGYDRGLITVAFLGDFEKEIPSHEAMFAFEYLMKLGMVLDRIGSSYRLESLQTSCATGKFLGDALDKEIKSWEMWNPSSLQLCPSDTLSPQ